MKSTGLKLISLLLIIAAALTICLQTDSNPPEPLAPEQDLPWPSEWMDYQRAYPNDHINPDHYYAAMSRARMIQQTASREGVNWELAGPTNIGGRITDLGIHPSDLNTMYVGAASGGILKTTDGGQNWEQIFADAATVSIGDLAIDPANPDVIYAGTGEANSSSYSFLGDGIYKSVNGGQSWYHIGLATSAYIGRIVVDHNNSNRLWVAACGYLFSHGGERGIYKSSDGGNNWENVLFVNDSTAGIDIVQHPADPDLLYASMWERRRGLNYRRSFGDGSGVWKSTDGGENWTELTNGLPTGNDVGRIGLDIAASDPSVVYAFYDMPSEEVRVYRSDDNGETWTRTNDGSLNSMNSSFGWYFGQVRVDPANEDIVYVLGMEMHRSLDGGSSWQVIASYNNINEIYVDHHAMFIDEATGRIFEGNDGGLYYSDDYGDNWTKINNLPITQFYYIENDFQNPERIYGGTQDNNTIRTMTGNTNDWQRILGGDGFYCLVNYENGNHIYAESQYGNLYKSTNGGYDFNYIAWDMYYDRKNWMSPLVMDPANPEILYFGTHRVWKTSNGGSSWIEISGDLTQGSSGSFHTLTTLAISPLNTQLLAAGSADGRVHVSDNGGSSWTDVSAGLPDRWITQVAFDPFEENTLYATVSGFRWEEPQARVYKSENLGQEWTGISGNLPELPVNDLVPDPEYQNRLFIGTDAGVFYTEDGGQNWEGLMHGLPNVAVVSMKIHNPTRTLIMGTYGISAQTLDLNQLVGMDEYTADQDFSVKCFPNPVRLQEGKVTFEYDAKEKEAFLHIHDLSGKKIYQKRMVTKTTGQNLIYWNLRNSTGNHVKAGTYICTLSQGNQSKTIKLILHN
ncbi:MAG: T9SS type A sorting domain-containing protein [Bacteroidales bacterium]|nr:T9SS type A sorting domain-containing protein [Bacteroidales bacterium]MCF8351892.1 T9SS type A sorting domain-containing protein [Bacteroidales bacterium]